jgi:hypothetical protein
VVAPVETLLDPRNAATAVFFVVLAKVVHYASTRPQQTRLHWLCVQRATYTAVRSASTRLFRCSNGGAPGRYALSRSGLSHLDPSRLGLSHLGHARLGISG